MYIKHHFSSLHVRSSDNKEYSTLSSASHFDCNLKHDFRLREDRQYFMQLNSISIPVELTCMVTASLDSFNFEFTNDPNNRLSTAAPVDMSSIDLSRENTRSYFGEDSDFYISPTKSLSAQRLYTHTLINCLRPLQETMSHSSHLGGESGLNAQGLKYFARNLFNTWTGLYQFAKVKINKNIELKLRSKTSELSMIWGSSISKLLGLYKSTYFSTPILTVLSHDASKGDAEITGSMGLGSGEKLVTRRSHIYLECSVCEGSNIDGSFRKILKVIPVKQSLCSDRYLTYEATFPEFVKIAGANIQNICFSLRDGDGNIIDSSNTTLPTVLTCSLLEE